MGGLRLMCAPGRRAAGVLAGAVAAGAVVAMVVFLAAEPAAAHAELASSSPANGEVLDAAPERVVLEFTEPVDPVAGAVEVYDSSAEPVDAGEVERSGTELALALPPLDEGVYAVSWRATSSDSHPISGAFTFRVGAAPAGERSGDDLVAEVLEDGAGDGGSVGVAHGVARFLVFAGLAVMVGGGLFLVLLWPRGIVAGPVRWILGLAWLAAVVGTAGRIGFQAAQASGGSWAATVDPALIGDVLGTRPGRMWLLRLVLLAGVLPLWRHLRRGDGGAPGQVATGGVVGGGAALLLTVSLAGHAATGDLAAAAVLADLVHLVAAAFWVGGLVMLLGAVLRDRAESAGGDGMVDAVRRFSTDAAVAVAALAVTGTFQGWRQARSLDALTGTDYGQLLLVKVGLVVGIVAVAAVSRSVVRRWRAAPEEPSVVALRRSVGVEAAGAAAVLAVTSLLVNAVPAAKAGDAGAAATFSSEASGDELLVQVTVDPAAAGPVEVEVRTLASDGVPVTVDEVTAELSSEEHGISDLPVGLAPAGTGVYRAAETEIPFPGTWDLEVVALTGETTEDRVTVEVPIS